MQEGDPTAVEVPTSRLRSAGFGAAIGAAVAVAATAIVFSIIAMPLYLLARTEPGSGVDRDLIRKGLFGVAVPVGVVIGVGCGIAVGIWYARGGRLPRHPDLHDER